MTAYLVHMPGWLKPKSPSSLSVDRLDWESGGTGTESCRKAARVLLLVVVGGSGHFVQKASDGVDGGLRNARRI